LIHDYLYVNRIHGLSRRQVDKLFYEQMLKLGVPKRKALIMYRGVQLAGWTAWNKR
jgi:hypothetical protein